MWLVVGLGNPGRKYERNRHNVGFRVVDELERRHQLGGFRDKFGGQTAAGTLSIGGRRHKVLLLKPMEFMNLSGYAVQRAVQFHDIDSDRIIVIHDEIDIDFERLKLKAGGGPGGHNGLRSIIEQLGSRDFLRVRVGVGKPGAQAGGAAGATPNGGSRASAAERDRRIAGYVLSDFPGALEPAVEQLIGRAADATETIIDSGLTAAMNQFHSNPNESTNSLPEPRA